MVPKPSNKESPTRESFDNYAFNMNKDIIQLCGVFLITKTMIVSGLHSVASWNPVEKRLAERNVGLGTLRHSFASCLHHDPLFTFSSRFTMLQVICAHLVAHCSASMLWVQKLQKKILPKMSNTANLCRRSAQLSALIGLLLCCNSVAGFL